MASDNLNYIIPGNEEDRLEAIRKFGLLNAPALPLLDEIALLASEICRTPIALITIIDKDQQFIKAHYGIDLEVTSRDVSFCTHTIIGTQILEVNDTTQDDRFCNNPFVTGEPHIRFYAGAPIEILPGISIGSICVFDTRTRQLNDGQKESLQTLSRIISKIFRTRLQKYELETYRKLLESLRIINEEFIADVHNRRSVFVKILNAALSLTNSAYGFFGEVLHRNGQPYLKTYSVTDISWNQETRDLYKKYEAQGMEFTNLDTLFGYTLRTGETVISNNPSTDPRGGGLPKGHPAMRHYTGIAIKDQHNNLIGMIGLANKPGGYYKEDVEFLSPLISTCSSIILGIRSEAQKQKIEIEKRLITQRLLDAQAIAKIGSWEYNTVTEAEFWSEEKYKIFELGDTRPEDLYEAYLNRIHPDDRERISGIIQKVIDTGESLTYEHRVLFPDGRIKYIQGVSQPVQDENGHLVIRGTCQDVTEQKQNKEELVKFLDLSADLMCIICFDLHFVKTSRSFAPTIGYNRIDMENFSMKDLTHPEDLENTLRELSDLRNGKKSSSFSNRFRHKNGHYVYLDWTISPDVENQMYFATAKDVTEKAEIEATLIKSKVEIEKAKAKDIFLANMSHEIRTPLNAIIGFNDLLRETDLTEEQRDHVALIASASENLLVIINDILDISKLESGKLELQKESFSIDTLMRKVIRMNSARAQAKNIKITYSFDNDIPHLVTGDETRLMQIIINLMSNAIKFTHEGKVEVRVNLASTTDNGHTITFSIKDTGIGIDKSKQHLIFERFTQAENYTTREYGGTGLGLNIARSLVEMHGGKIWLNSESGIGSEFGFEIHFEKHLGGLVSTTESADNTKKIARSLQGKRILLVEDNEHNQLLARIYLERYKADVDIAINGLAGIDRLREKEYDLVLMDIQMPVMDGIQATQILRSDLNLTIPVIACSAHALESEKRLCLEAGMNDFIIKPYNEDNLINIVYKYSADKESSQPVFEDRNETTRLDDFNTILNNWTEAEGFELARVMFAIFRKNIPGDIEKLQEAAQEEDLDSLAFKAHKLSGSLSTLRLINGDKITRELERAARAGKTERACALAEELCRYLKEAENTI